MIPTLALLVTSAIVLFHFGCASRIVFPLVPHPEFNTPVMTNGFVGGPTDFAVIGNVTIRFHGCDPYSAQGMISLIPIGPCRREDQYSTAVNAGAAAVIFADLDPTEVNGRKSRIPLSKSPLEIPAVILSGPDYQRFQNLLAISPYLTLEITPGTYSTIMNLSLSFEIAGVSLWHQNIAFTWWFITLNAIFFLFYVILLGLVIYKFVRKIKATGFIWNISFVYLFFQAAFCILMIVRWIDPALTWGIYSASVDALLDTWPATWSFAVLVLMAFFWFEVINQFADTKVQAFLSKKMQIPFWILVSIIIVLPAINAILLIYITVLSLFIALGAISFATGMIVACFYIIVAVKALEIIHRSEQMNLDSRTRLHSLRKSRISIISSAIIAFIYPPCAFVLRYYIVYNSIIFILVALYVESVLLGVITFIQVWFLSESGQTATTHRPMNAENTINTLINQND